MSIYATFAKKTALYEKRRPDLIIMEINIPEMDGMEVLQRIREHSNTPVIFLTVKKGNTNEVKGLEMGADDYITKPFSLEVLIARTRAVLRRINPVTIKEGSIKLEDLEIDLDRRTVSKDGALIALTRTEWNLIHVLASNQGKILLNAELLTKVWGPEYVDDIQYLRTWMTRLRKKLGYSSKQGAIKTFPGIGYMLIENPEKEV